MLTLSMPFALAWSFSARILRQLASSVHLDNEYITCFKL